MAKQKSRTHKYITTQLFNFARDSYLERTSRPIYAIAFLLPLIILYEIGTVLINTDVLNHSQVRVVAFVWLQGFLEYLGAGGKLAWAAPPLVVVIILLGLQLASRKQWHLSLNDFGPMTVECALLSVPLIVLSLFLNRPVDSNAGISGFAPAAVAAGNEVVVRNAAAISVCSSDMYAIATRTEKQTNSLLASIVTGIGAGIYEELVFRLILICLLMLLFQDLLQLSHENSIVLSVLISAALFSAHHHVMLIDGRFGIGAPFNWMEFGFRTIAGTYFAILFAIRGFAVAAGTHAFYDIIATIVNAVFFVS